MEVNNNKKQIQILDPPKINRQLPMIPMTSKSLSPMTYLLFNDLNLNYQNNLENQTTDIYLNKEYLNKNF